MQDLILEPTDVSQEDDSLFPLSPGLAGGLEDRARGHLTGMNGEFRIPESRRTICCLIGRDVPWFSPSWGSCRKLGERINADESGGSS